jgi:hypothetical protein
MSSNSSHAESARVSFLCCGFVKFLHVCGAIICQKFAFLHLHLEAKSLQMDAKIFGKNCLDIF